ncbi:MAG: hydroxymethylglutaryl-CoA synthase [Candidatus Micrarchaeota archaeon]|nr:hydroxymethylglutaryl-CoA synthase [Candidatus Micrarchaeota archaeon]
MDVGIVGYGAYVPKYRIKSEVIAKVWGEDPVRISEGLGIKEKAVADYDEDSVTMAIEAGKNAFSNSSVGPKEIGAVFFGSESHPYAVKSSASIVAEALDITPELVAADMEFACRAGTAGMVAVYGMVKGGIIEAGVAIGSDTAQGRPADALEYSAASGGGFYIIGKKDPIAVIKATYSVTTDTPDFWRREGIHYPSHGGRFTGEPAYFKHVLMAAKGILEKTGYDIKDFDHVILHQPNAKFPKAAAKKLGVTPEQLQYGLLVPIIGNTYSGATLVGLANVLDHAKEGDLILQVSFGSGAGSDAFIYEVKDPRPPKRPLSWYLERKEYLDYATYLKKRRKIIK